MREFSTFAGKRANGREARGNGEMVEMGGVESDIHFRNESEKNTDGSPRFSELAPYCWIN